MAPGLPQDDPEVVLSCSGAARDPFPLLSLQGGGVICLTSTWCLNKEMTLES
jgi:hypothetical protein